MYKGNISVVCRNMQCQNFGLATELVLSFKGFAFKIIPWQYSLMLSWTPPEKTRDNFRSVSLLPILEPLLSLSHSSFEYGATLWEKCHVIGQVAKHYNDLSQCRDWDGLPHLSWRCRSVLGHRLSVFQGQITCIYCTHFSLHRNVLKCLIINILCEV